MNWTIAITTPVIAIGCYLFYQYKSKQRIYCRLNLPEHDGLHWGSGICTKIRNLYYGNSFQDRLWNYVDKHTEEDNPNADIVLRAFDEYCYNYEWSWAIGDKKALILSNVVQEAAPVVALELGTFMGYSAIVIAQNMPADGKLITVEFSTKSAELAKKIIKRAGLQDKITVVTGCAQNVISELRVKYNIKTLDFVFLDHTKALYVHDLQIIEENGLLRNGSVVFADNVRGEGSAGFSQYIRNSEHYYCQFFEANAEYADAKDGMERGIYKG